MNIGAACGLRLAACGLRLAACGLRLAAKKLLRSFSIYQLIFTKFYNFFTALILKLSETWHMTVHSQREININPFNIACP